MVGYDPSSNRAKLSPFDHSCAGAISSFVTRALLQPLDVLKIRFQLQIEPIGHQASQSKYRNIFQAVRCIAKEEGLKAFWKGHVPGQCLSVLYGIVQFSSFEYYTKFFWQNAPTQSTSSHKALIHTCCGLLSGCSSMIITHPLDLLRTRLVSQGEPKVYSGLYDAVIKIITKEGFKGFYKGLVPTMIQIAPYAGLQFGFYRLYSDALLLISQAQVTDSEFAVSLSVASGAAAGVTAKTLTYPLDVVKKRLQVQGFEEARTKFGAIRKYSGMFHCFRIVFSEEGLLGLFKGLTPSLLKAGLATACHFTVYEQICILMAKRKQ